MEQCMQEEGVDTLISTSLAKSLGLYGQRTGTLTALLSHPLAVDEFNNYMKYVVRNSYSNPPRYGADLAVKVIADYRTEWESELERVVQSIKQNKKTLHKLMKEYQITPEWDIAHSNGMFAMTGLTAEETVALHSYNIFIPPNGRINVSGLTNYSLELLVSRMREVKNYSLVI